MPRVNHLICPITLEPIEYAGITYTGSIYELSAITEWLKNHNTDPLTGIMLINKIVFEPSDMDTRTIEEIAEQYKFNMKFTNVCWAISLDVQNTYNGLAKISKNATGDKWNEYTKKVENLINENNYIDDYKLNTITNRPENTGTGCQFMNLSIRTISDKNFKLIDFSFSNLTMAYFERCNFMRCSFMGATLNECQFINCIFKGEQTNFHKVNAERVLFIGCAFEKTTSWMLAENISEIKNILHQRGMPEDIKLIL